MARILLGESFPHARLSVDTRGVAVLTISLPKSMNILGTPQIVELTRVLVGLRDEPELRVLLLRASGDEAFIGGADIHEMSTLNPTTAQQFITRLKDLC